MSVQPGIYRHYKGGLYRVLFTALESTNSRPRQEVVVYVSLNATEDDYGHVNVRDADEFSGWASLEPRFRWVRP